MNIPTEKVEHLLRKAPTPTAPAGLLEDLRADIILPRATSRSDNQFRQPSFLRRWMPVLSLSLWLMACLLLLGVQIKRVANLKAENARLRAASSASTSVAESASATTGAELERLRADNAEVLRLRTEIDRLRNDLALLTTLKAENERLSRELQGRTTPSGNHDFIAAAAEKNERVGCIANLKQVGLGARLYANDHGNVAPKDFSDLQNELPDARLTYCPASNGSVRFEILSPGEKEGDPTIVFARCPAHNNVLLMDGSAHQLGTSRKVVTRADGKPVIGE